MSAAGEALFWYRPACGGSMYEGPVHTNSADGKLLRDAKPSEWLPLYTGSAPGLVRIGRLAVAEHDAWVRRNETRVALRSFLREYYEPPEPEVGFSGAGFVYEAADDESKAKFDALNGENEKAQRQLNTARAATRRAVNSYRRAASPSPTNTTKE